jgi:hypothetical protein
VYICFPAIYFLPIATNISYHLSFIRKPVLDNKPAQPWIVLLLALMLLLCPSQHISNWSKCGLGGGGRVREVGRAFRGLTLAAMEIVGVASQQVFINCQDKRTYRAQIDASNGLMLASLRRATSPQHCVEV